MVIKFLTPHASWGRGRNLVWLCKTLTPQNKNISHNFLSRKLSSDRGKEAFFGGMDDRAGACGATQPGALAEGERLYHVLAAVAHPL